MSSSSVDRDLGRFSVPCSSPASPALEARLDNLICNFASFSSFVTGGPRSGVGVQVTLPVLAASNLLLFPSSPARPRIPAISCTHRKLDLSVSWVSQGKLLRVLPVIIGRNWICHPCGICVSIDNTDCWDIIESAFM